MYEEEGRKNGPKQHVSPWKGDIIIPESDIKTNNTRESYKKNTRQDSQFAVKVWMVVAKRMDLLIK